MLYQSFHPMQATARAVVFLGEPGALYGVPPVDRRTPGCVRSATGCGCGWQQLHRLDFL